MDLFDFKNDNINNAPLADKMRPKKLEDFLGQTHILNNTSLLMRAIATDKLGSCIFYGPPGTGKTTLASIIANTTKGNFAKLNAVSSGVADAKAVIDKSKLDLKMYNKTTYLLLDECHRWSKSQSDCVLSAIEDGSIVFIGSTTENPLVSMTRAIVSRCRIFELKPLLESDIIEGLKRAVSDKTNGLGNYKLTITEDAYSHFAFNAAGDLRNALNALELATLSTPPNRSGIIKIDRQVAIDASQKRALSIDEGMHYNALSAFCKSLRGSDPNAALFWAFRLTESGSDPMIIFRRLIVHASEDVGMADPNALTVAVNACLAYERIGYTEGSIPLTQAIIYVATAPKSNSVVIARQAAIDAVHNCKDPSVPFHLRCTKYPPITPPTSKDKEYSYPHDFGGYIKQQYLPDCIKNEKFYNSTKNGNEKSVSEFLKKLPTE